MRTMAGRGSERAHYRRHTMTRPTPYSAHVSRAKLVLESDIVADLGWSRRCSLLDCCCVSRRRKSENLDGGRTAHHHQLCENLEKNELCRLGRGVDMILSCEFVRMAVQGLKCRTYGVCRLWLLATTRFKGKARG